MPASPIRTKQKTGDSEGQQHMGPDHYLAPGQDQAFYGLLVKHLQLLDQVNPRPQAHSLEQPAVSCGGWGRTVSMRAWGPCLRHTGPQCSLQEPGPHTHVPTRADEQHCIGGSIQPHDAVSHEVGEVGVLLHKQGPAPARPHLLLHQRVLLDEVEGVVRQLQRTGVAMATVPVVDALEGGVGG